MGAAALTGQARWDGALTVIARGAWALLHGPWGAPKAHFASSLSALLLIGPPPVSSPK